MEFRLLGPLEVLDDAGSPLPLGGRKPRALLTLLLLHPNKVVATDRLVDAMWGERPPASAHGALQVHVHTLRKALGAERIVTRAPGYLVQLAEDELDATRFARLLAEGRPAEALALWRGPALADVADESFAVADAARLEDLRLTAQEARIEQELAAGRQETVAAELEALVTEHPHRERFHAYRMLALYRAGRQADALAAYRDARAALDELGLEPSAELRSLEQQILRQDPQLDLAPSTTQPASVHAPLPPEPTPLVGRELEIAAVHALLGRSDTRLVTLTGPGGTGKTRLAIAAAKAGGGATGEPVFVDLSAVTDPRLVLPTIGHALGADESPGLTAVATVVAALGPNPPLLVLDNFEQVLDAARDVAALLAAAPTLRLLVTSRAPLRIGAERAYPVPPLDVPRLGAETAGAIDRVGAVRLYVERARATLPGFTLTDENAAAVARICRALDGLPLALELAAARIRTLGPEGTAARLGERLALLARGARDLPERQRSLRATLDWSVNLLDDNARRVLAVLAAFVGGATLDQLEGIADDTADVPAAVEDLLDAALLTRQTGPSGEPRFGMPETIREYASELLAASSEELEVRDRHAAWFLHQAEGDVPYWQRPLDAAWLDSVEVEHDNMRAALGHARAVGDVERELRLVNALRYFWRVRGYVEEGRRRLEEAVALADGVEPALRARTLGEAGVMAFAAGDYAASRARWSEALPLLEELGDTREIGRARGELGTSAHAVGDYESAMRFYESARELLADAGDLLSMGTVLANLAAVYHTLGEVEHARTTSLAALEVHEQVGDVEGVGITRINLASLELGRGDLRSAASHLEVAHARLRELGYREQLGYALLVAAELALALGRPDDAGSLLGSAWEQFRILGSPPQAEEAERYERIVASLRSEIALDDGLARGAALTQDDVDALVGSVVASARE